MKTRGKGLRKQEFYSFCSQHLIEDENCELCKHGVWINIYKHKIDSFIHDHFYKLWHWYMNR